MGLKRLKVRKFPAGIEETKGSYIPFGKSRVRNAVYEETDELSINVYNGGSRIRG